MAALSAIRAASGLLAGFFLPLLVLGATSYILGRMAAWRLPFAGRLERWTVSTVLGLALAAHLLLLLGLIGCSSGTTWRLRAFSYSPPCSPRSWSWCGGEKASRRAGLRHGLPLRFSLAIPSWSTLRGGSSTAIPQRAALLLNEVRGDDGRRQITARSAGRALGRFGGDWVGPGSFDRVLGGTPDAASLHRKLRALGATHLLVPARMEGSGPLMRLPFPEAELRDGFELVYRDARARLYVLRPAATGSRSGSSMDANRPFRLG